MEKAEWSRSMHTSKELESAGAGVRLLHDEWPGVLVVREVQGEHPSGERLSNLEGERAVGVLCGGNLRGLPRDEVVLGCAATESGNINLT